MSRTKLEGRSRGSRPTLLLSLLLALAGVGCTQSHDVAPVGERSQGLTIQEVDEELDPGSRGPEVRAVHEYLTTYGYFPNAELAGAYTHWLPVVPEAPADLDFYGPELEEAVHAFQGFVGLPGTGKIDLDTLAQMKAERCLHPENEHAALAGADPTEKWALNSNPILTKAELNWFVTAANPDATTATTNTALNSAFQLQWGAATNKFFIQSNFPTIDVEVKFYDRGSPPAGWPNFPSGVRVISQGTNRIAFNTLDFTWNTQALIQASAIHEMGHILGLDHSSLTSVMRPTIGTLTTLQEDDRNAIGIRYNFWEQVSGLAVDIAAGGTSAANSAVWVTSGGNTVWKWNPTQLIFEQAAAPTDGVSIAVSNTLIPWVASSANQIFRRTCANVTCPGLDWTLIGNGRDIGIGGTTTERIWAIGNTAQGNGNFDVRRFNGLSFVAPVGGGAGTRIAVDSTGRPWVVQANGAIFRRNTADNGWELMPGCARDIGAGNNGAVYAIGCGEVVSGEFGIFIWNEQPALAGAVSKRGWVALDGFGAKVSGSPIPGGTTGTNRGSIWVSQTAGPVFRRIPEVP